MIDRTSLAIMRRLGIERAASFDDDFAVYPWLPWTTRLEYNPQYSPDGRRVAFESERTGSHGIWTSQTDGSNAAPLYLKEASFAGTPRWSPDSQRIAFDSGDAGNFDIYVISAAGGLPLQVTDDPAGDFAPSWSEDGQWIYFSSNRSGRYEVWKVSAAGGAPEQVTQNGGAVAFESPDGQFLYFVHGGHLPGLGSYDLWKLPVEGGEETLVMEGVSCRNFTVTQNGIYFMKVEEPEPTKPQFSIRYLDLATSRVRTLATLPPDVWGFHGLIVSPDEQTILYSTGVTAGADLMLIENFR